MAYQNKAVNDAAEHSVGSVGGVGVVPPTKEKVVLRESSQSTTATVTVIDKSRCVVCSTIY